jgi:hypothetical protein
MRNSGLDSITDRGIGADRELMRLPEPEKINTLLGEEGVGLLFGGHA